MAYEEVIERWERNSIDKEKELTQEQKDKLFIAEMRKAANDIEMYSLAFLGMSVIAIGDKKASEAVSALRYNLARKGVNLDEYMKD